MDGRKVVLVTGASHGIGMGIALRMAENGWDVAFSYRTNAEGAAQVKKQIEERGASARYYQAEICHSERSIQYFSRFTPSSGS